MAPEIRLAVLLGSLVLWLPALTAFLAGDLDIGTVGVRYAASLTLATLAAFGLDAVTRGYRSSPVTGADGRAVDRPARRADDVPLPHAERTEDETASELVGDV